MLKILLSKQKHKKNWNQQYHTKLCFNIKFAICNIKIFNSVKNVFRDRKLLIQLKTRLLKCFVLSVLMDGCKTWILTTKARKNVEATEMWLYRRILRIS